ncbi:MAG: oligosaccharide flippase family protein [Algibacter sp.]
MSKKNEYRAIFKVASIIGSVEVFNIVIAIIRSKVIALFLGPLGMGINGLFSITLEVFSSVSGLGIDKSSVKEISFFNNKKDDKTFLVKLITLIRKLSLYAALLGSILMIVFSSLLSKWVFDSESYVFAFVWLSLALFFKQLTQVNFSILQGLRAIPNLAKANMFGSFISLIVTVPLYYFFKIEAIVPAIIISYIVSFLVSYFFQIKNVIPTIKLSDFNIKSDFIKGKQTLKLGVLLSFSGVITVITTYVFQIYLRYISSLEIVGLYLGGMAILNYYVNIVFNAMGKDYYPRLASIHNDNEKVIKVIQQQALIAILTITPIIVVFVAMAPFFIQVLYSSKFLDIIIFVKWGILGMLFKAISWSIGYSFIAKGDSKVFLKTTVVFNLFFLGLNILGYHYYGLEGLGISFFLYYGIHLISVFVIAKLRYGVYFTVDFGKLFFLTLILCLTVFMCSFIQNDLYRNLSVGILGFVSIIFTLYHLNRIMDFRDFFNKKK